MGLVNFTVQRVMKREAKQLAKWAAKTYPVVRAQHPTDDKVTVHKRMFMGDPQKLDSKSERIQRRVNKCCTSVQGLCYMLAMDCGALQGFLVFRCLQFTQYMDAELSARGFDMQTPSAKKEVLEALDLLIDGWERFI